jgi:hypothetical protein
MKTINSLNQWADDMRVVQVGRIKGQFVIQLHSKEKGSVNYEISDDDITKFLDLFWLSPTESAQAGEDYYYDIQDEIALCGWVEHKLLDAI